MLIGILLLVGVIYVFQFLVTLFLLISEGSNEFDNKCQLYWYLFVPVIPVMILIIKGLIQGYKNFKELDSCR
jgi:hypothetical protein